MKYKFVNLKPSLKNLDGYFHFAKEIDGATFKLVNRKMAERNDYKEKRYLTLESEEYDVPKEFIDEALEKYGDSGINKMVEDNMDDFVYLLNYYQDHTDDFITPREYDEKTGRTTIVDLSEGKGVKGSKSTKTTADKRMYDNARYFQQLFDMRAFLNQLSEYDGVSILIKRDNPKRSFKITSTKLVGELMEVLQQKADELNYSLDDINAFMNTRKQHSMEVRKQIATAFYNYMASRFKKKVDKNHNLKYVVAFFTVFLGFLEYEDDYKKIDVYEKGKLTPLCSLYKDYKDYLRQVHHWIVE